jgi:hypothetical protein
VNEDLESLLNLAVTAAYVMQATDGRDYLRRTMRRPELLLVARLAVERLLASGAGWSAVPATARQAVMEAQVRKRREVSPFVVHSWRSVSSGARARPRRAAAEARVSDQPPTPRRREPELEPGTPTTPKQG